MTIETSLELSLGKDTYKLSVKMIRIETASYFFIKDIENKHSLLSGKTLELTFSDSFSLTEFNGIVKTPGIPNKIVSAIKKGIMANGQQWLIICNMYAFVLTN